MKGLRVVLTYAVLVLASSCDSISRPSEADVRQCVLASVPRIELRFGSMWDDNYNMRYPLDSIGAVEFGKTTTSGMLEMAAGAPKDTKIFPVRVHFRYFKDLRSQPVVPRLLETEAVRSYWLFKDSFDKLKCVDNKPT